MDHSTENVLIVTNSTNPDAAKLSNEIENYFKKNGANVQNCTKESSCDINSNKKTIAFSVGGDGTFLFTARLLDGAETPIIPVNMGTFGYITEVAQNEWKNCFLEWKKGNREVSHRLALRVELYRNGELLSTHRGINDAVITSTGISRLVKLDMVLHETSSDDFRGDGIILATPTGSTAYSLAAGGPIVHPEMEALIVTPISPFSLSFRPLVLSKDEKIVIKLKHEQRTEIILTIDGQVVIPLEPGDILSYSGSARKVAVVSSGQRNFFEVVRSKLGWSGGPND